MRTSPFRSRSRSIAWRAALLMILSALNVAAEPAVDASDLSWSSLKLQASRLGSTATIDVSIEVLPAAIETPKFIDSLKSLPLSPTAAEVQRLTVTITLDIAGSRRVRLENQLWIDPFTNTPLYLVRTRFGLKDYYQRFRFTREGVFRQQREPTSASEGVKPPESWTKLGENFYPFPPNRQGCSPIVETSMLITRIGTNSAASCETAGSFCVFHKRQLHRVSLHPQPVQKVDFDYLEIRAGQEKRHVGTVSAPGVSLVSRPIGSYRGDVEEFFRDGSQLILNPGNHLPLVITGELPLIGRVDMRLKEIRLK